MKHKRILEPMQLPSGIWDLARERTNPLLDRVSFFEGDLRRMLANAYIQGVTDVANNFNIARSGIVVQGGYTAAPGERPPVP